MKNPLPVDLTFQPSPNFLKGRVIMITGASSGIGRALALSCAAQGADLILLGRNQAQLEALYDQIEAETATKPVVCPTDLEQLTDASALEIADYLFSQFGRLDALVHNAALLGQRTPIENYASEIWQRVMQVNLNAGFLLTKYLIPLLKNGTNPSILFTSSGVGRQGKAFWGAYSASKFAVEGLSQILAEELTDTYGIRVNCVNPGATRTSMRATAFPAEDPANVTDIAARLPGYLWLLSDAAREHSGQSFDYF